LIALAVAGGVIGTSAATGTAYVMTHAGNQPMPSGAHTVRIYTVDDAISTVVAPKDRPGKLGRFIGMCDGDTYYMEVGGTGMCLVLNGPLGTVHAAGTPQGPVLSAADAAEVGDIVRDSAEKPTRVVLEYDGGWAGLVRVADLNAGGPVTGRVIH
jgi:hypothetical protein